MLNTSFNREDKQKLIEFLNIIAAHATFNFKTTEVIEYFKLLAHMQQSIIPKLDANILEVLNVVEPEQEKQVEAKKRK